MAKPTNATRSTSTPSPKTCSRGTTNLENDNERKLKLNTDSSFFAGLDSMEMDNRIRRLINRYADYDFRIDTTTWEVAFSREFRMKKAEGAGNEDGRGCAEEGEDYETRRAEAIKVSRGEENIFIWCFFLAIVELALDDDGNGPYNWVKYIYIDDPISSLDEHNAIAVANHLAKLLKRTSSQLKTVISTHHTLFFNVAVQRAEKGEQVLSQPRRVAGRASSTQDRGHAFLLSRRLALGLTQCGGVRRTAHASL